ncbi:MAG TPA: PepSY domain-containing protein [Actinopolymorphaceae bacterium]
MKTKIVIAAAAGALVLGGGATAALALGDDDGIPEAFAQQSTGRAGDDRDDARDDRDDARDDRDDDDSRDDRDDDRTEVKAAKVTARQAIDAAVKSVPGTVSSVELEDDDGDRLAWEVDILRSDGTWRSVLVDARTGKVVASGTQDDD